MPAAAALGLVGVSYHAFRTTDLPPDSTTVLTGGNGAAVVLAASLLGVRRIIAVGRSADRLAHTVALASDLVEPLVRGYLSDGGEDDGLTAELRARTGGRGADGQLDFLTADHDITAQSLFGLSRRERRPTVRRRRVREPDVRLLACHADDPVFAPPERGHSRRDMQELLQHIEAGRPDITPLLTHWFPLASINDVVKLLDDVTSGNRDIVK